MLLTAILIGLAGGAVGGLILRCGFEREMRHERIKSQRYYRDLAAKGWVRRSA